MVLTTIAPSVSSREVPDIARLDRGVGASPRGTATSDTFERVHLLAPSDEPVATPHAPPKRDDVQQQAAVVSKLSDTLDEGRRTLSETPVPTKSASALPPKTAQTDPEEPKDRDGALSRSRLETLLRLGAEPDGSNRKGLKEPPKIGDIRYNIGGALDDLPPGALASLAGNSMVQSALSSSGVSPSTLSAAQSALSTYDPSSHSISLSSMTPQQISELSSAMPTPSEIPDPPPPPPPSGDPLMLDLNHDGRIGVTGNGTARNRKGSTINPTVDFDLDGDGHKEHIEWSNGDGDGMLVDDRDGGATAAMSGSHEIDGTRLVGDQGGTYTNGYQKLAKHDTNHDGKISGDELSGLKVWIDDGDAKLEPGELKTLAELHISELSVNMGLVSNESGETLMRSTFTQDGKQHMTEDVWFGIDKPSTAQVTGQTTSEVMRQVTAPSNFATELRRLTINLTPAGREELQAQIDAALTEAASLQSALRHQAESRSLFDAVAQHRAAARG